MRNGVVVHMLLIPEKNGALSVDKFQKFLIISTASINSPIAIKNFTNLSPESISSLLIGPSHQQNRNYWYLAFSQKEWMPIGVINSGLCGGLLRGYCSPNRHSLIDLVAYKNNGSQFLILVQTVLIFLKGGKFTIDTFL
jgi:hypothetical protein